VSPALRSAAALGCALWAIACSDTTPPVGPPRTYRMGFSAIPPRPDLTATLQALNLWTSGHADAAILHVSVPYAALLAGITAKQAVDSNELGLANYYRAKGLRVVITVDATNGLDRAQEDPALVALGRSITDTAIQHLYRDFVLTLDTILHPDYLGLAAAGWGLCRDRAGPRGFSLRGGPGAFLLPLSRRLR